MSTITNILTSVVSGAVGAAAVIMLAPVELQGSSPGAKQNGNINVSGIVLAGKVGVGTNTPVGQVGIATTDNVVGVHSRTGGIGVWGQSSRPGTGYGGYFSANGTSARGVFGEASSSTGVNIGGEFVSRSAVGFGLVAKNTDLGIGLKASGGVGLRAEGTTAGQFIGDRTGMEATCKESGDVGKRAIQGLNFASKTGGQLGSSYGGVYSFDIVSAEYRNHSGLNIVRQISPIAFGTVSSTGTVRGTDNVMALYNNATKKWELIPLPGTDLRNTAAIVTPFTDGHRATATASGLKVLVDMRDSAGTPVSSGFSFIIMDTGSVEPK